jgi:hypothetical protein
MRSEFRAKDTEEIRRLRAQLYEQGDIPEVPQQTAFRIENGRRCKRDRAKAYYRALQTEIPFEDLFELATDEDYYGWGKVSQAALNVGTYLFGAQREATAVICHSGPSMIFPGLAMAMGIPSDNARLAIPVYVGMQMTLRTFKQARIPSDFKVLHDKKVEDPEYQCVILMPSALEKDDPRRKYKIAIIDDIIMTGNGLRLVKDYLIGTCGYKPSRISVGCCVCHATTAARHDETTPYEKLPRRPALLVLGALSWSE